MHSGMWMWWRRPAGVQTENQNSILLSLPTVQCENQSQAAPEKRGGSCDRKRGDLNMVGCWSEYNTRCWSTGIFKHSCLQGFQKIRENIQWTAVVRWKLLYRCQMVEGEWSDWMETIRRTTGTQITTSVCRKSPLNVQHVQPCSKQRVYLLIAIY